MLKALLLILLVLVPLAVPAAAQDRVTLGYGRIFNNDGMGDARDRWRTGSYAVSMLRGPSWHGTLPPRFGEVLELRARAEVIAPVNLANPRPTDRPHAGALSVGLHSHFAAAGAEARLGLDLVAIGPQTGLRGFQRALHRLVGLPLPSKTAPQVGNDLHPTLSAELGRSFSLGGSARFRPFLEAQAGVESYVRLGGDLVIGNFGTGALMLRDQVTGQRYSGIAGPRAEGFSVTLGGDVARVFDSAYLPAAGPVTHTDTRTRLRAGLHWRGRKSEVFYGLTRLGREFSTQPTGQTLGSLRLSLRF